MRAEERGPPCAQLLIWVPAASAPLGHRLTSAPCQRLHLSESYFWRAPYSQSRSSLEQLTTVHQLVSPIVCSVNLTTALRVCVFVCVPWRTTSLWTPVPRRIKKVHWSVYIQLPFCWSFSPPERFFFQVLFPFTMTIHLKDDVAF